MLRSGRANDARNRVLSSRHEPPLDAPPPRIRLTSVVGPDGASRERRPSFWPHPDPAAIPLEDPSA